MSLPSFFLSLCVACGLVSALGHAADADSPTADSVQAATVAPLEIGDSAPPLAVGGWLTGEPVAAFDRDHAYLLEFWATWCGPCKAAIPHVNEIHRTFAKRGLVVIGQNVWEQNQDRAKAFVAAQGERMSYRVAIDDLTRGEDGVMATTWLKALGQNSIPASVLVDKQGRIVWVGHPAKLTGSLIMSVLAGTYDYTAVRQQHRIQRQRDAADEAVASKNWPAAIAARDALAPLLTTDEDRRWLMKLAFRIQCGQGDATAACVTADALLGTTPPQDHINAEGMNEADECNEIAWAILIMRDLKPEHIATGYRIAQRASAASGGTNPAIQDTLARALFLRGDRDQAITIEQAAMELVEGAEGKVPYQKTLDAYRAGQLPATDE